jgi:hypothetical protein
MTNTDGLLLDSPARENYAFRLGRALAMLGLGAMMHVPPAGVPGLRPPTVTPRPFVRVSAQQANSTEAPAVIVAHSLVYAGPPVADGILQAGDVPQESPVGTAGVDEPAPAVALAEVQASDDGAPAALTGSPVTPEKPLPSVAEPPASDPPPVSPQALTAPGVNVSAPPSTYRIQPVVAVARSVNEEALVRQLLDEYTGAFERRDVGATKVLYPNVDGKALKRAFEQIASQRLTLEACGITISGSTANARCRGSATFQPRIGTRPVQIASREWTFDLSKQDTSWRIVNTYVR